MSNCTVPDTYDDGMVAVDDTTMMNDSLHTMMIDMDQDGFVETLAIDFDGDGMSDAFDVIDPTDGSESLYVDSDGDGLVDTLFTDDSSESIDPMDPATETVDDNVHGDPMAEIPYHQAQAGSNDCLPTSVAMVLSEVTGNDVPAADVVDLANQLGLLGEHGMTLEGGLQLLDNYGVSAEVQTGTVDQLRTMLDANTPVIIGLDSDDLYGVGDSPFADDMVAGHAVVITGIDDEAGLVYINDPGFPDGAGVAIPISDFEDAWQDADHSMIVADAPASSEVDTVAGVDNAADDGLLDTVARLVLLPFNLVLR